ncbi:helix-turn-helix domain-containing protein [Sorangium sp. So ce834]|uniref:helix-turn-helix domain-containing protein n=1 Tax=Sorangium sp. So ce834 TaxID=3133321 RepID=UPI003F5E8057
MKRILALLELDRGAPLAQVAAGLGVTRQTVYNWIARFEAHGGSDALRDRAGRGRSPKMSDAERRFLAWSLDQPPSALGYAAVGWTTALLSEHLAKWMRVHISGATVRRELRRLDYVWKRPRYVLQPDPDREKKTPNPPTNPASSRTQRRAC